MHGYISLQSQRSMLAIYNLILHYSKNEMLCEANKQLIIEFLLYSPLQVSWEECWWESSDYKGLRELGAAKKGTAADGSAWNEAWSEKMYHDLMTNEKMVERTAHK